MPHRMTTKVNIGKLYHPINCIFIHICVYNLYMPNRENIQRTFDLASSQWGLFTTAQALAEGTSRTQLSRLVSKGRIDPVSYGVYRLADGEETPHASIKAAWLSLFPKKTAYDRLRSRPYDAIVAGRTAACMHGDTELYESPYTFAVTDGKRSARKDIELHSWRIDECDIITIEGLPVTSAERTIADLFRNSEDPGQVGNYISNVCKRGHIIDQDRLAELLSPLAKRYGFTDGNGRSFARKLVSEYADAAQMQLAIDAFRRALEASPSYKQVTERFAQALHEASSATQIMDSLDFSQLPAMKAIARLQETTESYRRLTESISELLKMYGHAVDAAGLLESSDLTKTLSQQTLHRTTEKGTP